PGDDPAGAREPSRPRPSRPQARLHVMSLTHLGWTPRLEQQFQQHLESGLVPARVAREDRGRYRVLDGTGEHAAEVAGRFHHEATIAETELLAPGVPVVALSARDAVGLEGLDPWVTPGATVALLGSSGVGKSTLVNALLGEQRQATREVRESDSRGRHTTTH